ncbi:hypothetical protein P692DRAFT_20927543, partial [Suillus brevipes Sb2]
FNSRKNERRRLIAEIVNVCFGIERAAQVLNSRPMRHVRYLWLVLGLMVRCISAFYTFSTTLSMSDPIRKTTLHASLHRIEDIDPWCNSDQLHFYDHGLSCLSRNPSLGKSGFSFSCRGYCQ